MISNYREIPGGWIAKIDNATIAVQRQNDETGKGVGVTLIDWQTTLPAQGAESESWLPAILGTILQRLQSTEISKIALTLLCTASGSASGSAILTEITKHTSVIWLSPNSIKTGLITLTASCLASLRELSPSTNTVTGRAIVHDSGLSPSTLCAIGWLARLI